MINNLIEHASTGKDNDSFVGLKIKGNEIHFFYPESYHFDKNSKTLKNDILSLLKTINLAKTRAKDKAEIYMSRVNDTDFALSSYLWVIKDYLKNGIYVNREKVYKQNQKGKVNWKRTLENDPIVSNGNVIYKDIVVETKNNVDNLLVEVHKFCIKKSIDYIGWIFNLNSNFIKVRPFNDAVKKQYLIAITSELAHTFEDDKKVRLTHLKNVIQGLDATLEGKDIIYGVDKYDYIFERMIDCIFGNQDVTEFYPKGTWNVIRPVEKSKKSSDLRPDTVFVNEVNNIKSAYILDSKFYRFGYTGEISDLPETTSIQKQIVYGDFVKTNKKDEFGDRIYNAFLLPFDKTNEKFKTDDNMIYIGNATTDSNDNSLAHEKVYAFLIDLKHVVDTYNNYSHTEDTDKLVSEINNLLDK